MGLCCIYCLGVFLLTQICRDASSLFTLLAAALLFLFPSFYFLLGTVRPDGDIWCVCARIVGSLGNNTHTHTGEEFESEH